LCGSQFRLLCNPYRVFPNLLLSEIQIDGPLQCVVSDMTACILPAASEESQRTP